MNLLVRGVRGARVLLGRLIERGVTSSSTILPRTARGRNSTPRFLPPRLGNLSVAALIRRPSCHARPRSSVQRFSQRISKVCGSTEASISMGESLRG